MLLINTIYIAVCRYKLRKKHRERESNQLVYVCVCVLHLGRVIFHIQLSTDINRSMPEKCLNIHETGGYNTYIQPDDRIACQRRRKVLCWVWKIAVDQNAKWFAENCLPWLLTNRGTAICSFFREIERKTEVTLFHQPSILIFIDEKTLR